MVYSLDGTNFSPEVPTGTNAGTYTVYYKVRRIVVRPRDRVLVRVDDSFPVQHRELRLLFRAVVQERELRRLDLGRDGLGVNGYGNRGRIHGYAGIVGGPVYLIIDGVSTRVGPGGNLGREGAGRENCHRHGPVHGHVGERRSGG